MKPELEYNPMPSMLEVGFNPCYIGLVTYELIKETTEIQFRMLPPIMLTGVSEPITAYVSPWYPEP